MVRCFFLAVLNRGRRDRQIGTHVLSDRLDRGPDRDVFRVPLRSGPSRSVRTLPTGRA